jgi:predicted short-subunit dehydrogenase-like oxidoreductase (DUF2520 family)
VGGGRLGTAIVEACTAAGVPVSGPHGRGYDGANDAAVLLCVPDDAIAVAASAIVDGPLVGHCSGASGLEVLGVREGFSVHPLMTVTHDGADFKGAWAATSGSTSRALAVATALAAAVGLRPVQVAEADRVAYHAAAAFAANFLITVESAAAELMSSAGLSRDVLLPLTRAALENWGRQGSAALTGPIARGDRSTVASHREVVRERTPDLLGLFDALAAATERLATADRVAATGIGSAGPIVENHRSSDQRQHVAPQPSEPTTS